MKKMFSDSESRKDIIIFHKYLAIYNRLNCLLEVQRMKDTIYYGEK
jgi:hypothetical protein